MDPWMKPPHELLFDFHIAPTFSNVPKNISSTKLFGGEGGTTSVLAFLLVLLITRSFFARFISAPFPKRGNKWNWKSTEGIVQLPSLPLIGPLHIAVQYMNDLPKLIEQWTEEFGHIAWKTNVLGKPIVVLNNAPMIQKLLSSTDPGHVQKPSSIYQKMFLGGAKHGLISSETSIWSHHRPVIGKAFSYEFLKSYLETFTSHAESLVKDLNGLANQPEGHLNISNLLHVHTLGMISHIVIGPDVLNLEESQSFHKNFERYKEIVSYRFRNPWLIPDFAWKLHPFGREVDTVFGNMERSINTCLQRYKAIHESNLMPDKRKCVLDAMIHDGFTEDEIFSEVISLVVAGHETVSLSLTFLLFLLALNPDWQTKCREEVDQVFQELLQTGGSFSMETVSELKLLERCIKETIRLLPVLPVISRELGKPLKLDENTVLNTGTLVFVSPWMLHRNPDYYPNPNDFDPDRFLAENSRGRSSFAYLPFSGGQRNCVGWKMAMIEMKVLAAFILQKFQVSTMDRLENIRFQYNLTILPDSELDIQLRNRSLSNNEKYF